MLHAGIASAFASGCEELQDVEWLCQGGARVARVDAATFRARPELAREIFGPYTLLITARDVDELTAVADGLEGQLTATVHGTEADFGAAAELMAILPAKAGRFIANGSPMGVEVVPAMTHGGPYPACTDARFTAVGSAAVLRWARPVSYQNFADALLPPALQNANPLGLLRLIDGQLTRKPI
jgi:alpha-ketoglutaric semialdehyde dehydrogenase